LIPPIPETLYEAAFADRATFGKALIEYAVTEPKALKAMPFVLGKTLGKALGSVHLAALGGMLQVAPKSFYKSAIRAGFHPGPTLGEDLFQAILDHPEGIWVGKVDPEDYFAEIKTADGRINLHIPELLDELEGIEAQREEAALILPPNFPDPHGGPAYLHQRQYQHARSRWNKGKRACTLAMHPEDAAALNLQDGQQVKVTTEAGSEEVELEIAGTAHKGTWFSPTASASCTTASVRRQCEPPDEKYAPRSVRYPHAPLCSLPGRGEVNGWGGNSAYVPGLGEGRPKVRPGRPGNGCYRKAAVKDGDTSLTRR
jgi:hypothetical protein